MAREHDSQPSERQRPHASYRGRAATRHRAPAVRLAALAMGAAIAGLAFQPETTMLRRVYEENLARRQRDYGAGDARTAQAARDLGLFLNSGGDTASARRALAEAVRIDDKALGRTAAQTLEDVAAL